MVRFNYQSTQFIGEFSPHCLSFSLPGATLGRKLVFTLHGWAGTPACWSLPPWSVFLSSSMVSSRWTPAKSGQFTQSAAEYIRRKYSLELIERRLCILKRVYYSCLLLSWFVVSPVKRFVKPKTPPCVLCVRRIPVIRGTSVTVVSTQRSVPFWYSSVVPTFQHVSVSQSLLRTFEKTCYTYF